MEPLGTETAAHAAQAAERSPRADTRALILPIVLFKLATLALVACAALAYPAYFNDARYIAVYRGNHGAFPTARPSADIVFRTWDAEHYLELAAHGYGRRGPQNAYYPLYPLLVRLCAPVFGGHVLATALWLSTALGIIALLVLHDVLAQRCSARVARLTVLFMCLQPAAFFSVLPYSESLFLLLLALLLGALGRERPFQAAGIGALLAMTRAIGVFSVAPIAVMLFDKRRPLWHYGALLGPLIGWAAYCAVMYAQTGDPWLGFSVQKQFVTAPSIARLFDPLQFVRELAHVTCLHGVKGSLLERAAFVAYVCGLWTLARRARTRDRDWLALSLPFGLIPAVTTQLMSFTRYVSVVFPLFCVLAEALAPRARRGLLVCIGASFGALQLWLLFRHVTFRWAD